MKCLFLGHAVYQFYIEWDYIIKKQIMFKQLEISPKTHRARKTPNAYCIYIIHVIIISYGITMILLSSNKSDAFLGRCYCLWNRNHLGSIPTGCMIIGHVYQIIRGRTKVLIVQEARDFRHRGTEGQRDRGKRHFEFRIADFENKRQKKTEEYDCMRR